MWRILHNQITDNVFWTSIKTYMEQHKPNSILLFDELWNIMQTNLHSDNKLYTYNISINDMMNAWMTKKQYPQLYVEQTYLYNSKVFSLNISSKLNNVNYPILVTYMTKSESSGNLWINLQTHLPHHETILASQFDEHDWIIVNLQYAGYYRVNYNTENWKNLGDYLYYKNLTTIHVLNRAQIIDDAFYYVMQRKISFTMFWNITKFLHKDTAYVAWYPMIKAIEYMTCIFPMQNSILMNIIKEMFHKLVLNIGYYIDSYLEDFHITSLTEEAVKWACILDAHDCRKTAVFQLENDLAHSVQDTNLPIKEWTYCKGLMAANHTIWYKVYEKWEKTNNNILLEYLTCSTNPDINHNYLSIALLYDFIEKVSNNNTCANIVLLIVAKHAKYDTVFKFIFDHLEFIKLSSKKQIDQIAILIVIITHDTSVDRFEKISFFVKNNLTMSDKQLVNAVEQKINKRKNEHQRQVEKYGSLEL